MNFYYLAQALNALVPDCAFGCGDTYDSIEWYSTNTQPLPTEQEVVEKDAELKYQEEVNVYQEKRKLEYPDWEDQLDKIYHDGIDAWKADIKVIKDKYPKQAMDATELQKRKDAAIFKLQKRDYEKAVARLAQYELSAGKFDEDRYMTIPPLPISIIDGRGETIRNPLVVQDETERKAAQEIINKTPQAVIDSINT
jgi:dGTP triphosphohydrolase